MKPFFSIIIPVYNVERFIKECIDSVINQNYTSWELILVDDGSTDDSVFLCDYYSDIDERITVYHKNNGGASDSRNFGLDRANGEYIIFLDSDDYWNDSNALLTVKNHINNADVLLFGCTDFNMKTGEIVVSRNNYDLDIINNSDVNTTLHYLMLNKLIPGGPTIFSFKLSLANNNAIRFKTGIQDEDYDFVLSVFLCAESITAINSPFYMYRQGRMDSVTGSSNIKMIEGINYTVNKWTETINNIEDELIRNDVLNYLAFIYSTGFVVCGRMDKQTRKAALKIMKQNKSILKYSYWIKPKITNYAIKILGMDLFSVLSSKYYDKTHIQTVNR